MSAKLIVLMLVAALGMSLVKVNIFLTKEPLK
jgi:hypothetical protein